jgi:hypothetical protein
MAKLIPEIELRVHLAKAEEFWRQDRLDLANDAMRRALKTGIPVSHVYNLQRTIEAEWGARQVSEQVRIDPYLTIEAQEHSFPWWDQLTATAKSAHALVTSTLEITWSKPVLMTMFPFDEWVEFMHSRYGYYTDREPVHKVCLPPATCSNPVIFRRAAIHEITHAAVHEIGGDGVPRWFNEGLAVFMEGAAPRHSPTPKLRLNEISAGFESLEMDLDSPRANLCYALAGDFVGRLLAIHGITCARNYLRQIGKETVAERAFKAAFGISVEAAENDWRHRKSTA